MRKVTVAFFALILALLGSGCGQQGDTETGQVSGQTTLTMWHYYTATAPALQAMADRFNEQNPDLLLELIYLPFSEITQNLSIGIAAGALPDLVIIDAVDTAAFASAGVLYDLTAFIDTGELENFLTGPVNSNIVNERIYGIPFEASALGFFYNIDILNSAGISQVPQTWDEVLEASSQILAYNPGIIPFGITAVRNEQSTFQFIPLLYSALGAYNNLDSAQALRALTFMQTLMERGYMSPEFLNQDQDDIIQLFAGGQVAMMLNGPWAVPSVSHVNFSIANIPRDQVFASVLGGANLSAVNGENAQLAIRVINFFLERQNVEDFAYMAAHLPIRIDTIEQGDFAEDPIFGLFADPLTVAVPRGPDANWPQISENIQIAIQSALIGSATPQEALEQAQLANEGL